VPDRATTMRRLSWDPTGELLAAKVGPDKLAVFELESGKRWDFPIEVQVMYGIRFSPDGQRVACGTSHYAWVWDFHGQTQHTIPKSCGYCNDVSWSRDGSKIACNDYNYGVSIFDAETFAKEKTFFGATRWVDSISWSPDGSRLIAGSEDGSAYLWDVETGHLVSRFKDHVQRCSGVAWSKDGSKLVTASHPEIRVRQIMEPTGDHTR